LRMNLIIRNIRHEIVGYKTKRITAVEYVSTNNGTKLNTVFAEKQVIISAGSIYSSKIFMLSGNVPREELKKYDIKIFLIMRRNIRKFICNHYYFLFCFLENNLAARKWCLIYRN
ncbi:unnamed protein product, partial [Heterotrigona itama]